MPPASLKLQFLQNPQQRIATGKSLPTKPLECLLMYGKPEQRMKAVKKIIPAAYSLSQHQVTHHVLLTFCKHCGNTDKVELLFALRRHIVDMARSKVGNTVLQELTAALPRIQQREIAREFVEELEVHCKHKIANQFIAKMLTLKAAADEISEKLRECAPDLATHPLGQHAVAALIANDEVACEELAESLDLDALFAMGDIGSAAPDGKLESTVLVALMKNTATPYEIKEEIVETLREKLDGFVEAKTHGYLVRMALEHVPIVGDAREKLLESLAPRVPGMLSEKNLVGVVVAMAKACTAAERQQYIVPHVLATAVGAEEACSIALDPIKTLVLRQLIEGAEQSEFEDSPSSIASKSNGSAVAQAKKGGNTTAAGKKPSLSFGGVMAAIAQQAATLSTSPVASPVLQKMYQYGSDSLRRTIYDRIKPNLAEYVTDGSASYLLQAVMGHSTTAATKPCRDGVASAVLAPKAFADNILNPAGSRCAQLALKYATSEVLTKLVKVVLKAKGREGETGDLAGVKLLCLDKHASFAIQVLLDGICAQGEPMIETRRELMGALKPFVFSLALSPWAGQVVLSAMLTHGSEQLAEAIRNVVFLKAENWLTEVPMVASAERAERGSKRPTLAGITTDRKEGGAADSAPKGSRKTTRRDPDRTYLATPSEQVPRPKKKARREE